MTGPACWSCGASLAPYPLLCPACQAVQPPQPGRADQRLGLDRVVFDVDTAALEQAYLTAQRQIHPDRMLRKPPQEQLYAGQQAAALNEAYETLKTPLKRAYWLLAEAGEPIVGETTQDQALLMETLEQREALAEADTVEAVAALQEHNKQQQADTLEALRQHFAQEQYQPAQTLTLRLKYLEKFAQEAQRRRQSFRTV